MPIHGPQRGGLASRAPGIARVMNDVRKPPFARAGIRRFGKRGPLFPALSTDSIFVTGVTKDAAGAPLGSCVVQLFRTHDDAFIEETVSDGSGNYSLRAAGSGTFYVVAYKAGGPDVAGTTVNTLIPA